MLLMRAEVLAFGISAHGGSHLQWNASWRQPSTDFLHSQTPLRVGMAGSAQLMWSQDKDLVTPHAHAHTCTTHATPDHRTIIYVRPIQKVWKIDMAVSGTALRKSDGQGDVAKKNPGPPGRLGTGCSCVTDSCADLGMSVTL